MTTIDYLRRIGIDDVPEPTLDTLFRLQKAHLYTVPYENLDILAGVPLSLKTEDLYDKIVTRRRGGYCFELNELYGWLLRQLGYGVTDFFARFLADEVEIPKRRHHVLKVIVPGEACAYMSDVGVGTGSPTYPIRIEENVKQRQDDLTYRLVKEEFLGWILEVYKRGEWRRLFSFTEEPQLPHDFLAISYFCEKSPDSVFNKAPMVAMRMDGGRKTLDGNEFRRFENDRVTVKTVTDPAERDRLLEEWFGIKR